MHMYYVINLYYKLYIKNRNNITNMQMYKCMSCMSEILKKYTLYIYNEYVTHI